MAATMTQSDPPPLPLPTSPLEAVVKRLNKNLTTQTARDVTKIAKLQEKNVSQSERDKGKIAQLKEDHCSDKRMTDIQTKKAKLQTAKTKSIQQAAKKTVNESLKQIST